MGHAQFHKGRMKGDDPEIDTAQTPKRFERRLALLGKTRKTFTDSIPNNSLCPQEFVSPRNCFELAPKALSLAVVDWRLLFELSQLMAQE